MKVLLLTCITSMMVLPWGTWASANTTAPSVFLDHYAYGECVQSAFLATVTIPYNAQSDIMVSISTNNPDSFGVPTSAIIRQGTRSTSFLCSVDDFGSGTMTIVFYMGGVQLVDEVD